MRNYRNTTETYTDTVHYERGKPYQSYQRCQFVANSDELLYNSVYNENAIARNNTIITQIKCVLQN